ncbi:MAG: protein from nitrogen regulatory protein P-II (GLNB) family, ortholog YAAQ B. subtilis, partial [uncultured Thermomicrobiales bacterium]
EETDYWRGPERRRRCGRRCAAGGGVPGDPAGEHRGVPTARQHHADDWRRRGSSRSRARPDPVARPLGVRSGRLRGHPSGCRNGLRAGSRGVPAPV